MKLFFTLIMLIIPTLTLAHGGMSTTGLQFLILIPISAFCLSISFFISGRAKSPFSFVGLLIFSFISCYPAIYFIISENITFESHPELFTVQVILLLLLILPFALLCKFTINWKKDYSKSGEQSVDSWRKSKENLDVNLKNTHLEYSVFTNDITKSAYLNLKSGMYILKIYSNETGNETLVSDSAFDSFEQLNDYLTNSTNFRVRDFLV